jgi:tetratricopeptide (TPR) repeat protein
VFSTDTSYVTEESDAKRWFNLSHLKGKGAESKFAVEFYDYPIPLDEENLLDSIISRIPLNAIGRIVLTEESNKLLHKHVRKSMKIAVEVMSGGNHFIGFIDAEDLNQVGRKKLRCVVPLKTFNTQTLAKNCNYSSVFYRPKSILKSRKSKKELDRKSFLATISESPDECEEVSVTNKDGEPVFIVVELELEKPFNEEIYEDASEQLIFDDRDEKCDEPVISQKLKLESFRRNLETVIKNVSNIYGKETEVSETVSRMISDGYFASIEDHLLPEITSIGLEKFKPSDDFNESRDSFMCEITSHVLNAGKTRDVDRSQKILLAQVFEFLGLEQKSEEIFLKLIFQNDCQENWIAYAVHNLRKEKFNKTVVCIEETGKRCSISLIGHILKCYVDFKLQNYSECWRLLKCMKQHHGNFLELTVIGKIISMVVDENDTFSEFSNENFKQPPEIQESYNAPEMLWFATTANENLLNWNDPLIHCAIMFIKLGCFDFAELVLGEYLAKHGFNINFLYLLAVINAIKGNHRQALFHLEQIAKEDIGNHQVHYNKIVSLMSLMLIKLDDFQSTQKLTRNINLIENFRLENFLFNFTLGQFYNDRRECKTSLEFLTQAHRTFPSYLTFMQLGKCYQKLNKLSSAEACFCHAINCDLDDSFAAWNHLYDVYMKQNRMEMVNLCTETLNCF